METPTNHVNYYQLSAEETLKTLKSKREGLDNSEAAQRIKIYGENKLIASKKIPLIFRFFQQFKDLMVIILIAAGSISLYLGEDRDAIIMYTIVIVNAIIGFIQEFKAEKTMNSLKNLIKAKAKVIRNGQEIEIPQEEVVPGDIVKLEEGDAIPADLRIIEENTLSTNDFALTGESNPTRKFIHAIKGQASLGDRNNLVFMGTTVATGNGFGVVIHTGMETEIGRIANLSQETKSEDSPLQKEINHLAKTLTIVTIIIGSVLMGIGLLMHFTLREAFLFGLGIAASCVPEGLPAQVSVALSLAAGRLARQNAVIKKLSAVETLGSTHIICTDKTGTLTKNEMTVQKILIGLEEFDVTGTGYEPTGTILDSNGSQITCQKLEENETFFRAGTFASNASINPPDTEHKSWYAIGDPTEAALISLAKKVEEDPVELDKLFPEIKEFTFDSIRKRMSSIRDIHGKKIAFVKGSPQSLLEKCTQIKDGTKTRPITEEDKELIIKKDDEYATQALRVLAYAYKEIPSYSKDIKMEEVEEELIFLGLAAMIDPPRDEVKAAIDVALKAHIRVIIITGDYALTAEAIAKKIGFNRDNSPVTVVKGEELDKMSDIDLLQELINSNLIFSRTSPENKLRIVSLLKKAGEIVAVTGDGVNDAPALKKADIGVAMGKTGTEVAKDSSEIVLLDDSFATLVIAIREGRTIFQNLKKTILSTLTSNGGELFAVLLSLAG
ncbi:MAG: HAD-IC family P-type ATPase, partial [Candidatus Gracilibacteria bacterium]